MPNQFLKCLEMARQQENTFYRRRAERIKAFFETHPENLHPVKEVTYLGEIIRDKEAELIDISLRCVADWWDLIGAGPMELNHSYDSNFHFENYNVVKNVEYRSRQGKLANTLIEKGLSIIRDDTSKFDESDKMKVTE